MADQVNAASTVDGINDISTAMDQWLAMQEPDQQNTSSSVDAGSLSYQLEMNSAFNSIMSGSNEIHKQAEQNAKESGNDAPVVSF